MKKNLLIICAVVFVALLLISGTMYNGGSPGAKTGSPKDGSTCTYCHSGTAAKVEWISSDIPGTGYVPGDTYIITVNADDASAVKMGFEVTAENATGKQGVFTLTDAVKMKLTNGNKAVTHKSASTPVSGKAIWSFNWTAPVAGTGEITFYGAINAANGNGSTSGDKIYTSTLKAPEATTNAVSISRNEHFSLYPNPAYGFFFVESASEILNVSIFDLSGRLILKNANINSSKTRVDLDNVKPGIYIVKTMTSEKELTNKIQLY